MEIPTFDGAAKSSAKAWVQKLDAYLQLNSMMELDAIKFATIYLEVKDHEWWYHGITTLGNAQITSYRDLTQRLMDRFDQDDPKLHFRELTQLRQTGSAEAYIEEFQRITVMVPDVSEARLMMLFSEGLTKPLCGWLMAFKPTNLHDAIWKTRDLAGATQKNKFTPRSPFVPKGRESKFVDKGKGRLAEATKRELRRKQLCYMCKEPWEPGHKCMGKGKIHYIEVLLDSEEEEDEVGHLQNMEVAQRDEEHTQEDGEEDTMHNKPGIKKAGIASISGVQRFSTFRINGVLQGQRATMLINGGASHSFIDSALVNKRHLPNVEFEGFLV